MGVLKEAGLRTFKHAVPCNTWRQVFDDNASNDYGYGRRAQGLFPRMRGNTVQQKYF